MKHLINFIELKSTEIWKVAVSEIQKALFKPQLFKTVESVTIKGESPVDRGYVLVRFGEESQKFFVLCRKN